VRKQRSSSPATHPTSTPQPNPSSPDGVQAGHAAGPWQCDALASSAPTAPSVAKITPEPPGSENLGSADENPWANDIWARRSSAAMPMLPDPRGSRVYPCPRRPHSRAQRSDGVTVHPPSRMPPFTMRKTAAGIGLQQPNVLKPLAKAGAAVLAVDHLAKSPDSRAQGPGGTAAKRCAIGGVSVRVKARRPFTPGRGGEALPVVNKDRTAECERTARLVTASLSSAFSGCLPSTTGFLNGSSGHLRTGSETTTRQRHRMTSPPSPRLIHHRRRSTTPANASDGGSSSAQPTHYERGVNLR
jgi:hypothetical protein